jgi:hypothetical protein
MRKEHRLILKGVLFSAIFSALPLAAALKDPVKTQSGGISGVSGTDPSISGVLDPLIFRPLSCGQSAGFFDKIGRETF